MSSWSFSLFFLLLRAILLYIILFLLAVLMFYNILIQDFLLILLTHKNLIFCNLIQNYLSGYIREESRLLVVVVGVKVRRIECIHLYYMVLINGSIYIVMTNLNKFMQEYFYVILDLNVELNFSTSLRPSSHSIIILC